MRTVYRFAILASLGLFLAVSCGGSGSLPNQGGTGGTSGGTGGAGCKYQHYFAPGCGSVANAVCVDGAGGACFTLACGCSGKVIVGCAREFEESYAYTYAGSYAGWDDGGTIAAGMTCDPTSDAAQ